MTGSDVCDVGSEVGTSVAVLSLCCTMGDNVRGGEGEFVGGVEKSLVGATCCSGRWSALFGDANTKRRTELCSMITSRWLSVHCSCGICSRTDDGARMCT